MFQQSAATKVAGLGQKKNTKPRTERHLTGFAQLAVLAPLHLLVREDFLQRPGQKHALGFTVLRLRL